MIEVQAQGIVEQAPNKLSDLETVFSNVVGVIIPFGGIVLFIMVLYGGFRYITSGANPRSVESSRATITYAIAGIVLLAMGYLILVLIQLITGAEVTVFRIFNFNAPT